MSSRLRSRLTYANVMSTVAVFFAVGGGTAVALNGSNTVFSDDITDAQVTNSDLAANSVGPRKVVDGSLGPNEIVPDSLNAGRIAPNAVGGSELAANAVTGAKVTDNTLTGDDLDESSLSGVVKDTVIRFGQQGGPGAISAGSTAICHSGEVATGGGGQTAGQDGGEPELVESVAGRDTGLPGGTFVDGATPTRWATSVRNDSSGGTVSVTPFVVCARR
jgi:hypothetical protein